jgi:hypothetical protein
MVEPRLDTAPERVALETPGWLTAGMGLHSLAENTSAPSAHLNVGVGMMGMVEPAVAAPAHASRRLDTKPDKSGIKRRLNSANPITPPKLLKFKA